MNGRPRVVFVTRVLPHYRVPFHEAVRQRLEQRGIDYELLHGSGRVAEEAKDDLVTLAWASRRRVSYFGPRQALCWQHGVLGAERADLMIIGQENTLLVNYPLIASSWFSGRRLAFFGHGRGFQARSRDSLAERFKRFWASKVHWWFAYTTSSRDAVTAAGFPAQKVTVFNNAIDTSGIVRSLARLDPARQERLRSELVAGSRNVGVYVGGLYAKKRVAFLLEAAERIRGAVPDFHLILIGAGADAHLAEAAAAQHDWIHYCGPKFGDEKTALVSLGKTLLMPGLVGVAVLDSFAYGAPMVTTNLPFHSPEFDYLEDGINGVMVRDSDDPTAYARAVMRVLEDDDYRLRLQEGGRRSATHYGIEQMADRFVEGVVSALDRRR